MKACPTKITAQRLEIQHNPNHNVDFLAHCWDKKYVQNLQLDAKKSETNNTLNLTVRVTKNQLYTVISGVISAMEKKYTSVDTIAIGFVAQQFDFTSVVLLEPLLLWERSLIMAYFKVINNILCMP